MKFNQWTLGLAAVGVVSLGSAMQAEEATSQVLTAVSGTTLSGYVNTSAIWKFGTGNALPGRAFDGMAKQDSFNLDVVKVSLEKPLEEAEYAAGYKVDMLYGPDATTLAGRGALGGPGDDVTLLNAHVDLRAPVGNGLDIKIGVFESIIGYEAFDAGSNPNYSRSYGYVLEPWQHAGVLASYRINEIISVSGGVANAAVGAANSPVAESIKTYMGAITLTAPESMGSFAGSTLYAGIVEGYNGTGLTAKDTVWVYTGATLKTPIEQLSLGAAFDYRFGGTNPGPFNAAETSNWAYAVSVYASYQVTEKLRFNNRAEYATGSDGTFYASGVLGGQQNELFAYTGTLDYSLWDNVITRAEFRWDHALEGKPFGVSDENAMSVAANIIYKF